ncbi:MAG: hypothetical protein FWH05_01730, partial [Oscillospiraceae bacterium]|nr:hypothetical protein [Oscillospiraceae bacterium]
MTIVVSACADGFEFITATPPGSFVLGGGFFWNVLQKWVWVGWRDGRFIAVTLEMGISAKKTIKNHTKH